MTRWAAGTALLLWSASAAAQKSPMLVITDTPEYCEHLAQVAARHHKAAPDALRLAADGAEMCEHGAVRAGIARVRRALIHIRQEKARPGALPLDQAGSVGLRPPY